MALCDRKRVACLKLLVADRLGAFLTYVTAECQDKVRSVE